MIIEILVFYAIDMFRQIPLSLVPIDVGGLLAPIGFFGIRER